MTNRQYLNGLYNEYFAKAVVDKIVDLLPDDLVEELMAHGDYGVLVERFRIWINSERD